MSSRKEKVVGNLKGVGRVVRGSEVAIPKAPYRLRMTQTVHVERTFGETEEIGGLGDTTGRLFVSEEELWPLVAKEDVTLVLEDGRSLDIIVMDPEGSIQGSGGIRDPEPQG